MPYLRKLKAVLTFTTSGADGSAVINTVNATNFTFETGNQKCIDVEHLELEYGSHSAVLDFEITQDGSDILRKMLKESIKKSEASAKKYGYRVSSKRVSGKELICGLSRQEPKLLPGIAALVAPKKQKFPHPWAWKKKGRRR